MKITGSLTAQRALGILVVLALLVPIITTTTSAAPPQQGSIVYYVRYGDTLFSIAQRFGTTVPAIMQANGLTSEYIFAGQRLSIPTGPVPPLPTPANFACTYIVQYRDTVYSIGYRYGVPWYVLMQANYMYSPYLYVGQQLRVPCLTPAPTPFPTYVVQSGDNLFRIAIKYNTSIYAIAATNGIWNPHVIYPGQTLVIPYPGSVIWPAVPTLTPSLTPTITPYGGTTSTLPATPTGTITATPSGVVIMTNIAFVPNTITISRGGSVMWKNQDSVNHSVVSGVPGAPAYVFTSGTLTPNQSFSFTFNNVGTYPYFSDLDSTMTGTITVQ